MRCSPPIPPAERIKDVAYAWYCYAWLCQRIAEKHKETPFRDYVELTQSKDLKRINFYDYIELCNCRDRKIKKTLKLAVRFGRDGMAEKWTVYAEKDGTTYLIQDLRKYNLFEYVSYTLVTSFCCDFNIWLKYVNNEWITPEVPFEEIVKYYDENYAENNRKFNFNGNRWLKYCPKKPR